MKKITEEKEKADLKTLAMKKVIIELNIRNESRQKLIDFFSSDDFKNIQKVIWKNIIIYKHGSIEYGISRDGLYCLYHNDSLRRNSKVFYCYISSEELINSIPIKSEDDLLLEIYKQVVDLC